MATHPTIPARTDHGQTTSSRHARGFASFALLLVDTLGLAGCATPKVPDIELYPAPIFAAGWIPTSVALGDVNGDGVLDLAVANSNDGNPSEVSVLLGNGDGSFQAQQSFAAGDGPSSVALGDVDGNGVLDLVLANESSNDVSVLLGNGDGRFQAQQRFAAGE